MNVKNERKLSELSLQENQNNKIQIPLRHEIKEISLDWIKSSTVHGLPRVFQTDEIYLKVLWLILFLGSFIGCAYISINYFVTYFQYNTNVDMAIATESPTNFPAISFCNLNPFYLKRSQNYINFVLTDYNINYLRNLSKINQNESAYNYLTIAQTYIKTYVASYKNLTTIQRKLLGWDIDEMLLSCYFNSVKCTTSDFVMFFSYDYGNCYTFNSGDNSTIKQISNAGSSYSLSMELFTGDDSYDAEFINKLGVYIVVHNQSVAPLLESEGIYAASGFETNVAIDRTFKTDLASPYSSCLSNNTSPDSYSSELYKAIFNVLNHKTYRQKYCYRLCYQKTVIQDCNCSDSSLPNPFPSLKNVQINNCITMTELSCLSTSKTKFQNSPINEQCSSDCPMECSSTSYTTTSTVASYPTLFYSNWLQLQSNVIQKFKNNQTTQTQLKSSVLKLNIFYNTMTYTKISETASITWDNLLGSIGGMLGLFLGMSILTFFEVIEIICEIVRILWRRRQNRRIE